MAQTPAAHTGSDLVRLGENGALVRLAKPVPPRFGHDFIGREAECRKLQGAWLESLVPFLVGQPGGGKTRTVQHVAATAGMELYKFPCNEDVRAEDLAFRHVPDGDSQSSFICHLSELATAMHLGQVAFLDDIHCLRGEAMAVLLGVVDDGSYLDIKAIGERIFAHENFRLIVASNTTDLGGRGFNSDALLSRLKPVIEFGFPPREEVDQIIRSRLAWLGGRDQDKGARLLDRFWSLWREKNGDVLPSPRDVVKLFAFARGLASFDAGARSTSSLAGGLRSSSVPTEEHLEDAFSSQYRPDRAVL